MGTNYYVKGLLGFGSKLHIGKSSGGWVFALHVIPLASLNNLEDWNKYIRNNFALIYDEYGRRISRKKFFDVVLNRGNKSGEHLTEQWLRQNYAVKGPNNLARCQIGEPTNCIGHVDNFGGSYDLITGDFS